MKSGVMKALISFSRQSSEFAQAIIENGKTFSDCMKKVAENPGSGISDLEAYRRAVQFYFTGADIEFNMTIDLCASVKKNSSMESISLMDLL